MLLNILLVIVILVCVALVAAILLQKSEGGALGMGGNGPGAFMTARGTGDFLTVLTQWLAGIFFALCLIMTLISGHDRATSSVVSRLKLNQIDTSNLNRAPLSSQAPQPTAPPAAAPAAPAQGFSAAPPAQAPAGFNPFGPNTAQAPRGQSPGNPAPASAPAKSSAPAASH